MKRRSLLRFGALLGFYGAARSVDANAVAKKTQRSATPGEIEGPFFPNIPQEDKDFDLTRIEGRPGTAQGVAVIIAGRVTNQEGEPIAGAMIDLWQANTHGRYRHPSDSSKAPLDNNFQGWALVASSENGEFRFKTIVPGPYPVTATWTRPPHLHFRVAKRGYHELITQMYFPGQALNETDRLLQSKSEKERALMVARQLDDTTDGLPNFEYPIVLKAIG